jgi:mannosyltransferase
MKIKLLYDNIIYQLQKTGGITTYWRELTSRISHHKAFQTSSTKGSKLTRYFPINSNVDISHSSYYRSNLSLKTKKVISVYDFIYELGFVKTLGSRINIQQRKIAIETADAIICISENTKKDLLSFYPKVAQNLNIYVVHLSSSFQIEHAKCLPVSERVDSISRDRLGQYILFIGSRKVKHKNFNIALMAFYESCLSKLGYSMICIGSKFSDLEEQLIASLGLTNQMFVIENATDDELKYLYQNAFALLYPSLYEGFGIPPLEAMSCGCPVVASNRSSLPEVVGDSGILIDPYEVMSISHALEKLLDEQVRNNYIVKGLARAKLFSWDEVVKKHIQIYQSLIKN